MRRDYRTTKIFLIITSLILASFTLFLVLFRVAVRDEDAKRQEQYELKISALSIQKKTLLNDYEQMVRRCRAEMGPSGSLGLLFIDINAEMYDIIYPETPFASTMCISPDSLPGDTGNISMVQFEIMTSHGWKTAIYYDGERELSEYLEECVSVFTERGFAMPSSILFWQNYYTEYDEVLYEYGIDQAIHFNTNEYPIFESSAEEGIWHPGAVAWNTPDSQNYLAGVIANGGHFVYVMGFTYGEEETDELRAARRVNFNLSANPDGLGLTFSKYFAGYRRMMGKLSTHDEEKNLNLFPLDEARAYRERYQAKLIENQEVLAVEKARVDREIAIIEKRILEIYEEFNK